MQARQTQSTGDSAWQVVVIASAAVFLSYTSWVGFSRPDPSQSELVGSLLLIALASLGAAAAAGLARRAWLSLRLRRAWLSLALASATSAAAETLWLAFSLQGVDPFPSAADFFYLLYYPFFLAGLLLLTTLPTDRIDRQVLSLDLGIALASSFIVWWYFVLSPRIAAGGGDLSAFVAIAYPVADAILLAILIARVELTWHGPVRSVYLLLLATISATAVADVLFANYEAEAILYDVGRLNPLWCLSSLSFLLAARTEHRLAATGLPQDLPTGPRRRLAWILLPYLGIGVGAAVLVGATFRSPATSPILLQGVAVGMVVLILLVLVRQYLVLRENVELHVRAAQAALTDELTGLFNRRYFDRLLEQEIKRSERFGHPMAVLVLDMDDLKEINDSLGHAAGDEALRSLSEILRIQLRAVDQVARLGGDEFTALLPETSLAAAGAAVARLEAAMRATRVRGRRLRASIGMAGYTRGITPSQLMEEADRDLYRVKLAHREASVAAKG